MDESSAITPIVGLIADASGICYLNWSLLMKMCPALSLTGDWVGGQVQGLRLHAQKPQRHLMHWPRDTTDNGLRSCAPC